MKKAVTILLLSVVASLCGCTTTEFPSFGQPAEKVSNNIADEVQAMVESATPDSLAAFTQLRYDVRKYKLQRETELRQTANGVIFVPIEREIEIDRILDSKRQTWYVNKYPDTPPEIKDAILKDRVCLGMSCDQVLASWDIPYTINRTVSSRGSHEQWVYRINVRRNRNSTTYLYFDNGILRTYQD
jgi:hypothetical protein